MMPFSSFQLSLHWPSTTQTKRYQSDSQESSCVSSASMTSSSVAAFGRKGQVLARAIAALPASCACRVRLRSYSHTPEPHESHVVINRAVNTCC